MMIWIETPYHGYLKVHVKNQELIQSKFEPTKYSFIKEGHWYLEEDVDAINFMKLIWKGNWRDIFQRLPVIQQENINYEPNKEITWEDITRAI